MKRRSMPLIRDLLAHMKNRTASDEELPAVHTPLDGPGQGEPSHPIGGLYTVRPPVVTFSGRHEEIARLSAVLEDDRRTPALCLSGRGGSGKTELALALAGHHAPRYPDARLIFDLQPGGTPLSPQALLASVIHALEPAWLVPDGLLALRTMYSSVLSGKSGLLLLDNAARIEQVEPLLPPPPGWAIIITSRRSLPFAGAECLEVDALPSDDACLLLRRLFNDHGRSDLLSVDPAPLAEVCGCVPLALHLTAGLLSGTPGCTLGECVARLKMMDDLPVVSALNLSGQGLWDVDEALAQRWHALGVFPAPFDLNAAAYLWEMNEFEAAGILAYLRDRRLVEYDSATRNYTLNGLLRALALRLPPSDALRARHAEHYLEVAGQADDDFVSDCQGGDGPLRRFDAAWPHLSAAWEWYSGRGDDLARRWLSHLPGRAPYLINMRLSAQRRIPVLKTALSAASEGGDRYLEAIHLGNLGLAHRDVGDIRCGIEYFEQQLRKTREMGDRRGEANALANLGLACADLGDVRPAIQYYGEARVVMAQLGDIQGEGAVLANLGQIYRALGEPEQVVLLWHEALNLLDAVQDPAAETVRGALAELGTAF